MTTKIFEISREGKNLRLRISANDLTIERLSHAFQVKSNSLYLKDEFGDLSFWATDSGRFNTFNLDDGHSFFVMGEDLIPLVNQPLNIQERHSAQVFSYGNPSSISPSSPKLPPLFGGSRQKNFVIVKVIHAQMSFKGGKNCPTFEEIGQTYINVSEQNATVSFIANKASEAFHDSALDLVTNNGLKITDDEGTRGLSFWKCPSCKVYAVRVGPRGTKRSNKSKDMSTPYYNSDDSDEDVIPVKVKPSNRADIETLRSEVGEIKSMVSDILQVNKIIAIPIGVVKLLKDTFICKICHMTPMKPPVIATTCCNGLLGCEECVNTWFAGSDSLSKKCPFCIEPRGYASTFQFKGLN